MVAYEQKSDGAGQLSPQDLDAVELFLAEQTTIPEEICKILLLMLNLLRSFGPGGRNTPARLGNLISKALGVCPSSEKTLDVLATKDSGQPAPRPQKRKTELERTREALQKAERLQALHAKRARQQSRQAKKARKRLKDMTMTDTHSGSDTPTPEEEAAQDAAEEAAEAAADAAKAVELKRGVIRDAPIEPALAPPPERLMSGGVAAHHEKIVACHVDRDELKRGDVVEQTFETSRQRVDFSLVLTALTVVVEKAAIRRGSEITMVTGDTFEIGPPKYRVTWKYLANMAILLANFAMPMHRFARLSTTAENKFTSAHISRYFAYVARALSPIYIHLGRSLANAPVLLGDDTPSLVLQVKRGLAMRDDAAPGSVKLPWDGFATQREARKTVGALGKDAKLSAIVAANFGFAAERKDNKGAKRGFNTSVLSGRTDAGNPKSTVVFYRSHLGSVGNLLDAILPERRPELKQLVLQTDLSTTNLISDKAWMERFDVKLAGCSSHARRPFASYRKLDPERCDGILSAFWLLASHEKLLNEHGRNTKNVMYVRENHSRDMWQTLDLLCEDMLTRWPKTSPLGEGANYLRKNIDRLTYYLTDAKVAADNNFSERMLRQEKLIANNSMFRQSIDGRCALDIVRTVIQTAEAADVSPEEYLQWVMKMPADSVAADPAPFTPYAFAAFKEEQRAFDAAGKTTEAVGT